MTDTIAPRPRGHDPDRLWIDDIDFLDGENINHDVGVLAEP